MISIGLKALFHKGKIGISYGYPGYPLLITKWEHKNMPPFLPIRTSNGKPYTRHHQPKALKHINLYVRYVFPIDEPLNFTLNGASFEMAGVAQLVRARGCGS